MHSLTRQYLFGGVFIAVAVYQAFAGDFLEFSLYLTAGTAFLVNALVLEPRLAPHQQLLRVITWVLIIAAVVQFLFLLQLRW